MFSQKVLSSVSTLVVKCLATSSPGSLSSSALLAKSTVGFLPPAASWSSVRGLHMSRTCFKVADAEVDPKWADNPKLIPNEEWAKRLTPESYFCTREGGTEPPFSGQYLNHKAEGIYTCVCCGSDIFSSKAKYDSGSGWPSFHSAIEDTGNSSSNVIRRKDISHGMCNSHLGHVFEDGPEPTRERFCVNSAALKFVPKKLS
ncbi:Methionine-R-sulfoxide reductase B2, mitochondrial [Folsomia candida]|uniref:Peptide-methionine (R)-S-oxide reductase n=1 Tax=Folsomia candida TaxID=158441 RepID=A0A226EHN9_FOLCA|nr:Methionine-R-sulfoxide reductase B2, mitochondrial [Folsomia candida]